MNEIDQANETASGGAPDAPGEPDSSGHSHESACLNCGATLAGEFCHACGQKGHVHRTLAAFGHDLLHGVFHLEGKTWRTLPMLAWRPGELTRRYIEGERVKFVSPLALFLFSVFLMFAVFGSVGGPFSVDPGSIATGQSAADLDREEARLRRLTEGLERQRDLMRLGGRPTAHLEAQIQSTEQQRRGLEATRRLAGLQGSHGSEEGQGAVEADFSDVQVNTGWSWLDYAVKKAIRNPSLLGYKLQSNAYKFSWALIPISVPFLALLFLWRRRHRRLYDHTVFVTYSIAFMTLLLIALSLLRAIGVPEPVGVAILGIVPPIHMFRQLKGAYELSVVSALWRTAALALFAILASAMFLLLALTLGVVG